MISPSFHQLLPLVFPSEPLEAFDITDVRVTTNARSDDETLHIHLEEKNAPPVIPEEHRDKRIVSKGFNHPEMEEAAASVLRHEGRILNFWNNRSTNAKLKHFRGMLRGIRDLKFFLFRCEGYFC